MDDVRTHQWDDLDVLSERRLRVSFWGGVCSELDHVSVSYRPNRIAVTLYSGGAPGSRQSAQGCPASGTP